MKQKLLITPLLIGWLLSSGCAAGLLVGGLAVGAAAGAGAIAYSKGELRSTESVDLDQAWAATQAGVKDFQFSVVDSAKDALRAKLTAQDIGKRKILIQLRKTGAQLTEIRIRVGSFGDEATSRGLLEAIRKHYASHKA